MADTELQQAGLDTEGMAESTAKLREEMLALSGVDIMQDDNTFKSTYQILDELSTKWSGLSDIARASVTELVAGKRQGNIMSALMTNFDIAREAAETARNSEGSAMRELGNYQQGIEYSMDKFKAQFQEFSNSVISSDFLKGITDFGTGALGGLTDFLDAIGIVPTVLGGAGIGAFFKNLDRLKIMQSQVKVPITLMVYHGEEYIMNGNINNSMRLGF